MKIQENVAVWSLELKGFLLELIMLLSKQAFLRKRT